MKRMLVALALATTACGSQWNMPFSHANPTLPSSIDIGKSSAHDVRTSSAEDAAITPGKPFVWPHLVTWHRLSKDFSSWDHVGTHPLFAPGGYDSLDTTVMQQLNSIMASTGMSPMVSWWGENDSAGDRFLDAYLSVPSPVRLGILFEVGDCAAGIGLMRFDSSCHVPFDSGTLGSENATLFHDHIEHLWTKYFNNPKYADRFVRIGGRPVVFIWLTGAFRGNFAAVAKQVKEQYPVYLVGSDMNLYNPARDGYKDIVGGLDAVSAYGIADSTLVPADGHMDSEYAARYRQALQSWSQWLHANARGVLLIPPILFAYDDTQVRGRTNSPIVSSPEEARVLMETLYAFIAGSRETCDGNVAPGTMVVSFNEDFEGSSVYPTREHGDAYLQVLAEFANRTLPPQSCK